MIIVFDFKIIIEKVNRYIDKVFYLFLLDFNGTLNYI